MVRRIHFSRPLVPENSYFSLNQYFLLKKRHIFDDSVRTRMSPWWIVVAKFVKFSSKEPVLKKKVGQKMHFWRFYGQMKIDQLQGSKYIWRHMTSFRLLSRYYPDITPILSADDIFRLLPPILVNSQFSFGHRIFKNASFDLLFFLNRFFCAEFYEFRNDNPLKPQP